MAVHQWTISGGPTVSYFEISDAANGYFETFPKSLFSVTLSGNDIQISNISVPGTPVLTLRWADVVSPLEPSAQALYNTLIPFFFRPVAPAPVPSWVDGGNTWGADSSLGNLDTYALDLITDAQTRMRITAAGLIGVGTLTPSTALHIAGTSPALRIEDGTESAGYVLTSDASGNASWAAAPVPAAWLKAGNAGTNPATDFVGTTDFVDLVFRANSVEGMRLVAAGGTTLKLAGNFDFPNTTSTAGQFSRAGVRIFHSAGTDNLFWGLSAGNLTLSGVNNTALGSATLASLTTGSSNVAVGFQAGWSATTGQDNTWVGSDAGTNSNSSRAVAVGTAAGISNSGDDCVLIGYRAGTTGTGAANIGIGSSALFSLTSGSSNVAVGMEAGYFCTTAATNVLLGTAAGFGTGAAGTFTDCTAVGWRAGFRLTSGTANTFVGREAGNLTSSGSYNNYVGYQAGYSNVSGSNNNAMGWSALTTATGTNNTAVGHSAGRLLTSNASNTFVGAFAGDAATGSGNTFVGKDAGKNAGAGLWGTFVGINAGAATTGNDNTLLGTNAATNLSTGSANVIVGYEAGGGSPGSSTYTDNVVIGWSAASTLTTGTQNVIVGRQAGANRSSGSANTDLGYRAGRLCTTSSNNTNVGAFAGLFNVTGSGNANFGYNAGTNVTGSNNLCLGTNAGTDLTTGGGNIVIGNSAGASSGLSSSATQTGLLGGHTYPIANWYFNNVTAAAPASTVLNAAGGSGTNIAGASLTIAGGKGTGTGTPGSVIIQTSATGASGTTLQTLATRVTVDKDRTTFAHGIAMPVRVSASSTNVAATDFIVILTTSLTTATLPSAPTDGQEYIIKQSGALVNNCVIDGNGKNIDGAASITMASAYRAYNIVYSSALGEWAVTSVI